MKENLKCRHCGHTEYNQEMSGKHLKATCAKCGAYIKFLAQPVSLDHLETEPLPMTKYKGKTLAEISQIDPKYVRWMASNFTGRYAKLADYAIEEYML